VEENIDFYSGIYRIPAVKRGSGRNGSSNGGSLPNTAPSRTAILSGGWKQRLALGCAILRAPIIFLDEPTSGVDPISRRNFWDLIYHLAEQGVTVFVTTHYMDEAEYCDRLGLIYRGELIALGAPEELKSRFMREEVIEVICDRPHEAMGFIEEISGIRHAALFGKGLHVVAEDSEKAMPEIKETLTAEGFEVTRTEKIIPSLEDVFVSLIEAHDRVEAQREFA
jgi:ABC-2 type transport system ATP-binding protein